MSKIEGSRLTSWAFRDTNVAQIILLGGVQEVYMGKTRQIVIVSDGTGKTATRLMDAVLAQYNKKDEHFPVVHTYQNIRTQKEIRRVLKEVSDDCLVIFSIITRDHRSYFREALEKRQVLHLDVLEPMLSRLSKFLGFHPEYKPGLLQVIDDQYYKKIDAIGYTVEHDDGGGYRMEEADLVLVGPSRTCKTPISIYLSCNLGLKVANIPILGDMSHQEYLLEKLKPIDTGIIFGCYMQLSELARIRGERTKLLYKDDTVAPGDLSYQNRWEIQEEIHSCEKLYKQQRWKIIDVTSRSIEEISQGINRELNVARKTKKRSAK